MMQRPAKYDEVVKRKAAELALPEVKKWLRDDFSSDEEIIEDLMDCIDRYNGFLIAFELKDRKSWECDSRLVEILDSDFINTAQEELEKQWVKCFNIKLDIPVGTSVKIKRPYRNVGAIVIGKVVKHYSETAKYGVYTTDQDKTLNWIMLPEEIEVVKNE